ncbi:DEAD/DEAH box helicase family protein [Halobacteriovorax sp. XZX-3]|uniref:DEAD/DEAH box helicase n=1 Tax=unclassified Halobacteriovorax TaxID=2639665 RepID=UPI003724753B
MSFFKEHKDEISFFHENLREAQIGGVGAIVSHFSIDSSTPGIIVVPTGVGKTAVISLAPFLLEVSSVLVITSSALVRSQVADEIRNLRTISSIGCYSGKNLPKVFECYKSLDEEALTCLNESDVVVGIPAKLIDVFENEVDLSEDFFDLVLVDESHHLPASTWTKLVEMFPSAMKLYFTATPYRRDGKPIDGKIIYNYPLRRAYEQGVFGRVEFCPVEVPENEKDKEIAKKAEEILNEDRDNLLSHALLVRTDSKKHAKELLKIYEENTNLNLKVIDSSKTDRVLKTSIRNLREGTLDGLICVDMLGEGFDFPNLKIAAIHKPHKSEAVTLQFIGRFARTNADDIGSAKFIAAPNDMRDRINALYKEGAVWNEIIIDIHSNLVDSQLLEKETVSSFKLEEGEELEDLSLFSIAPYCHVKIFNVDSFRSSIDINREIEIPGQQLVQRLFSEHLNCSIQVMVQKDTPKWVKNDQLENIKYHLYIIYYYEDRNLLFINSTDKSDQLYEILFRNTTGEEERNPWEFHISRIMMNKVLLDLNDVSFFNIGMQKRVPNSGESYRTLTGPNAQSVIQKTDGVLFSGGHMFCKGVETSSAVTIGYSSASKLWSNSYKTLGDFISWCKLNGEKLFSARNVKTNSGFDHLPFPRKVEVLPKNIFTAYWDYETYRDAPTINITGTDYNIHDFDIKIRDITGDLIKLSLIHDEAAEVKLKYSISSRFEIESGVNPRVGDEITLTSYLNEKPILFQTIDFGVLSGDEFTSGYVDEGAKFSKESLEVYDWVGKGINIESEFGNQDSIHEKMLEDIIATGNEDIIIYDHGPGEIADIVTFKEMSQEVIVSFYHVKASSEANPGNRVNELYEVCGQVVKSVIFANHRDSFKRKLRQRVLGKEDRKFKKSDYHQLDELFDKRVPLKLQMYIVQPGLTKDRAEDKMLSMLESCDHFISQMGNFSRLKVLCSR